MSESRATSFITLPIHYTVVFAMVSMKLVAEGFLLSAPFELQSACSSLTDPICPHTRESPCGCTLLAMYVNERDGKHVPLVLHGHGGQTEIFLDRGESAGETAERVRKVLQEESETLLQIIG